MPRPSHRSRKSRKVKVTTPGGRSTTRHLPRKPGKAHCSACGKELHGMPRTLPSKKLPRTAKRPERPYGGNLCSKCTRQKIRMLVE